MTTRQLSRRTLAKGGAWVAPALVATSAAPALAASVHPGVDVSGGSGCKPRTLGDDLKEYYLKACFTSTDIHPLVIDGVGPFVLDGTTNLTVLDSQPAMPYTLAPGATACIVVRAENTSASMGSLAYTFSVTDTITGTSTTKTATVAKSDVVTDCTATTGCKDGYC